MSDLVRTGFLSWYLFKLEQTSFPSPEATGRRLHRPSTTQHSYDKHVFFPSIRPNCCRMMLENIDDWIPAPREDKGKEKTTTTTEKKKKKKKKKLKKSGEEKTRRGKDSTSTKADDQESSPLSTSPPAPYPEPSTAASSSSMSTPTSPLVTRRRKDSLRWSSNELPTRTGGSDIVRSKVDLLGDLESCGDVEYNDVYDAGEGDGEEEEE